MQQKGFTLIELMITIAIMSILAVIMIPAFQDYLIRARVMEGLNMVEPAKLAVLEASYMQNALPKTEEETGFSSPEPTKNVNSIHIGSNGLITIQYSDIAGNGSLILTPTLQKDGHIAWDCTQGSLQPKYRPASCK